MGEMMDDKELQDIGYISNPQEIKVENILSVSQALRKNSGEFLVKGTLTSMTRLFKMISSYETLCLNCSTITPTKLSQPAFSVKPAHCSQCSENSTMIQNIDYYSVIAIELQDLETFNDLERLQVLLFEKDTENIRVGENVVIDGKLHINIESKGKKLFPCFYAKSIRYDKNADVILTQQDINAMHRFVNFTKINGSKINIIDELVKMLAPAVINYENIKEGLLYSAVNSGSDIINPNFDHTRQRIHSLLIGEKGLAKSKILRAVVRMLHNSRYETAQSSSVLSLTGMVSKEEENYVLRLGPIPLAKNAICAINEFGRTNYEDQSHFLDIMEEGWFTINKYGIHAIINSPTTIIASANPSGNSNWNSDEKIDLDEIPALKPVLDRFDLIFIFRSQKNETEIRKYAIRKTELESIKVPDYSNYVKKHLEYAKRFNPELNDEARDMLAEFFIKIRVKGFGSNRVLDSLHRISKAVARLKLKSIVDADDATDVMKFYNVMLQNFEMTVNVSANPKQLTYDKFIEILQNSKNMDIHVGISIQELHRIACKDDERINSYLGPKPTTDKNRRLKDIATMLKNSRHIIQVGLKPLIFKFRDNLYDAYDVYDTDKNTFENEKCLSYDNRNTLYQLSIIHKSVIPRESCYNKILQEEKSCHIGHIRHIDIDPNKEVKCPDCGYTETPYWIKFHKQNTGHKDWREGEEDNN